MGHEPIAARKELGSEKRLPLQTSKLNCPREGIFMVAQSEDEQMGAISARIAEGVFGSMLGKSLDNEIQNLSQTDQSQDHQVHLVDTHVRTRLKEAFLRVRDELDKQVSFIDGLERMSVKTTAAKMVDLPGGQKRMYIGHVGDARAYLVRGDSIYQLTKDQTGLRQQVESGFLTEDEYEQIDQAVDPSGLDRVKQQMFGMRDQAISITSGAEHPEQIIAYDVHPGDKILITNDGLHKNTLQSEIEAVFQEDVFDDAGAEKELQQMGDNQTGTAHPRGRSEAKPIAAVVYSVPEGRREKAVQQEVVSVHELKQKIRMHELEVRNYHMLRREIEAQLEASNVPALRREVLEKQLLEARRHEALHKLRCSQMKLAYFDAQIPTDKLNDIAAEERKRLVQTHEADQMRLTRAEEQIGIEK